MEAIAFSELAPPESEKSGGDKLEKIQKAVLLTFLIAAALAFSVLHESFAVILTPLVSVQPSIITNNSPSQGMKFDVNITVQNVSNCGSVQMTLNFNGTLIAIVGESFLPDANFPSPAYFQSGSGFISTNVTFGVPLSTVSPVTILTLTFKLYDRYCQSLIHIDNLTVADGSGQTLQSNSHDGSVQIRLIGDLNGDGVVNLLDAIILGNAFGSTPTSPNWNPNADLNGDGHVNILDSIILGSHFGK